MSAGRTYAPTYAIVSVLSVGLALGAAACGDDEVEEAAGAPIDKSGVIVPAKPRPAEPAEGVAAYTYSPVGKRDPFRSYLADLAQNEEKEGRPLQATEVYALDQYRLTALVTGTSQPKAMVEDPEGMGHVLRVGSRVGKNGGRVTRISTSGVMILEEFVNPVGKRVRVPITLKLPEDDALTLEKNN